jgi:hypothetical protein
MSGTRTLSGEKQRAICLYLATWRYLQTEEQIPDQLYEDLLRQANTLRAQFTLDEMEHYTQLQQATD